MAACGSVPLAMGKAKSAKHMASKQRIANQLAAGRAPYLYNSNSKQQPAPREQQQQPGSPPAAAAPPNTEHILQQLTPLSSAEVQRREQAAAAAEQQHKEDKEAAAKQERLLKEALERQRKIIEVLHKQLDLQEQQQEESEAAATAKVLGSTWLPDTARAACGSTSSNRGRQPSAAECTQHHLCSPTLHQCLRRDVPQGTQLCWHPKHV